ncbi:PREDICTED: DAZ-associated protein 2 [Nanorana parkeri]|uniref:DAZ-associated protein 2 n=1 Tax=Nanorana parkeri TaxID=125878 RepID=UPI000853F126|nr:PREDICTED: DAZ-associated protein 2 [Nanorana parkeri]
MNNKGQYPSAPAYPTQTPNPQSVYPPAMHLSPAPPYTDAPPAYSELYRQGYVHQPAPNMQSLSSYPGASMYVQMPQTMQQMGSSVPMAYYPIGPVYPPGSTVIVDGGYDAGARFGPGNSGSVPPPPPGCPPNAAQLAAMQGANVVVTQRKGNYFMGGSDGGYTMW